MKHLFDKNGNGMYCEDAEVSTVLALTDQATHPLAFRAPWSETSPFTPEQVAKKKMYVRAKSIARALKRPQAQNPITKERALELCQEFGIDKDKVGL